MRVEIRKSAIKDLQNINEPFKNKLHEKISSLKNFPNIPNIKKLTEVFVASWGQSPPQNQSAIFQWFL